MRADAYARQTASDRPGVAQPVPLRPVPAQPWGAILLGALGVLAVLLGAWEAYWRAFGVHPGTRNTYGLWSMQRRRIDAGEGDATVVLGSSRLYYDVQLPVWQRLSGQAPIQLSYEGTSPMTAIEDLAADPNFTGHLVVGVAPDLFFQGGGRGDGAAKYFHKESPAQRVGQWLSMYLVEPLFAFDDPDFALATVLKRQAWPPRPGRYWSMDVRKLAENDTSRNAHLWSKLSTDPQYRELARSIWREDFMALPGDPTPEEEMKGAREQIQRMVKAMALLRAHGAQVLFVRAPSEGPYLAYEDKHFPRARTWDALLAAAHAPGIYFQDYPQLQGYYLPEWSHMTQPEGERFTAALYRIIEKDFWPAGAERARPDP
ncbi:MAG: hypothetical protein JSR36_06570 [Proteobacteria bacterium]|nr:hypothetical protein [Pseudomonadota bacterium]